MNFDYVPKLTIRAAQWRQDNLDEMKELLKDVVGYDEDGPYVYAEWIEPYYYASANISNDGYYILKIEFDEYDPGMWVVVYEDGEIGGMSDAEFNRTYTKKV